MFNPDITKQQAKQFLSDLVFEEIAQARRNLMIPQCPVTGREIDDMLLALQRSRQPLEVATKAARELRAILNEQGGVPRR